MTDTAAASWLDKVNWNEQGLVPVIAQEADSGDVLTLAWMNREALALTASEGWAVYWSRSRQRLWRKGEKSGHVQRVREIRLDCDGDTVLLSVEQEGGIACHTGRHRCFFQKLEGGDWRTIEPVIRNPADIYGSGTGEDRE
jgi:phosphoribosyl-AMP cyclohydrolase